MDVDAGIGGVQVGFDLCHVGIAEMVRHQLLRLQDFSSGDALLGGHRVRLVGRKEDHVHALRKVGEFGDVLRVAGNVDLETVKVEDVAVAVALRVHLLAAGGRVVGGDRLHGHALRQLHRFPVGDGLTQAGLRDALRIHQDARAFLGDGFDGLLAEVVAVLVADEDDVGLRELVIGHRRAAVAAHRVDLDHEFVEFDRHGAVVDHRNLDGVAALGLEGLDRVLGIERSALRAAGGKQQEGERAQDQGFLHR